MNGGLLRNYGEAMCILGVEVRGGYVYTGW